MRRAFGHTHRELQTRNRSNLGSAKHGAKHVPVQDLTGRLARGSEGAAFHDDAVLEGKRRPGAIAVHDS